MFRKRIKNKQFDIIPRYYDPVKEDLENRLGQYNEEAHSVDRSKSNIKEGFRRKSKASKSVSTKIKMQSNIRLFLIIAMLGLLTYYVLMSDIFIQFVQAISG